MLDFIFEILLDGQISLVKLRSCIFLLSKHALDLLHLFLYCGCLLNHHLLFPLSLLHLNQPAPYPPIDLAMLLIHSNLIHLILLLTQIAHPLQNAPLSAEVPVLDEERVMVQVEDVVAVALEVEVLGMGEEGCMDLIVLDGFVTLVGTKDCFLKRALRRLLP
ncbi:hypothetical protein FGO68_gene6481 [Halteria grandinella]|uniref:Uncharacterized protein n=1 Tax=Halteria grandinella TaxID=5974 RepID=A0A8J8NFH2_HALGN|nr:hypothetical protein FGO68_gene6481 [Halteria grandinella]